MRGNDLTIYSNFANEWWEAGSPRFRSLQQITPFRLSLIRELCGELAGKDVVDLGCGGGLLSVPLLDQGAKVVGVDLSAPSVAAAQSAAKGRGTFLTGDVTAVPLPDRSADIVLLADVLDHVPDYQRALAEARRIVRPEGSVFVGTINRTAASWLFALFLGEGLRLIPPGTHAYRMFIRPDELSAAAKSVGLRTETVLGEGPRILETLRRRAIVLEKSRSCAVAYSMLMRPESL
jgi:2-polyprenyl-6-hydroxyphenyl methylase/3-demethylubiquinone-9 3-methyltransferase